LERFDPRIFIFGGFLVAIVGFLLLDGNRLPSRPSVMHIVGGHLIVGGIPYRFVLLLSVLAVAVGLYLSWTRKKA
jgi:hypothetical protein